MGHEAQGIPTSPASTVVRVITGHVVSSGSMVSRAYLADSWRGIVVAASDGTHWLACTFDALAPDEEGLLIRGEAESGLPRDYARATLTKIVVGWFGSGGPTVEPIEITVANPSVVQHPDGAPIGVVALDQSRDFAQQLAAGTGPWVHVLSETDSAPERTDVETLLDTGDGSSWPVNRAAWPSPVSGGDFLGHPGAMALDIALADEDAGSPAFRSGEAGRVLTGVVRPVGSNVAMLLPTRLIAETVAHAQAGDGLH